MKTKKETPEKENRKITKEKFMNMMGELEGLPPTEKLKFGEDVQPFKFTYACARNLERLGGERKAIIKAMEPDKDFKEWQKAQQDLGHKYPKKDESGKSIVMGKNQTNFLIDVTHPEYMEKLMSLEKKHKKAIDSWKAKQESLDEFFQEEVELNIYKMTFRNFPTNLSVAQMVGLQPMIRESEKEMEKIIDEE